MKKTGVESKKENNKKKSIGNKVVIGIIIIVLIIIVCHIFRFKPFIKAKAYIKYGDKKCSCYWVQIGDSKVNFSSVGLPTVGFECCPLCNRLRKTGTIPAGESICGECCKITGRCYNCGGDNDNNITINVVDDNTQINNNSINVVEDTKKDNNTSESTLIDITVEDNINLIPQQQELIQKGYDVLGYDFCKGHPINGVAGEAFTKWTCKICGCSEMNPNTAVPALCIECADLTTRCAKCGKINK